MVPFLLEMVALQRMTRTAYSTFSSMEPGVSLVMGLLIIGQAPAPVQIAGMALVVVAGIGATRGSGSGPAVSAERDAAAPEPVAALTPGPEPDREAGPDRAPRAA
jgi:inner membrane transporter RhtA